MSASVIVTIIGAPVACADGVKDAWRETAEWISERLVQRFGDAVRVEYFDLFDPACPPLPANAQLPLVLVNGQMLSSGGKISVTKIRKRIEDMGFAPA